MKFVQDMLDFAIQNMNPDDAAFWRGQLSRFDNEIEDLTDEQIQEWLNQSDYANQF